MKTTACVGIGFAGHQTSGLFNELENRLGEYGRAWPLLGRYAVGGFMLTGGLLVMLRGVTLPEDHHDRDEAIGRMTLAASTSVGAGVGFGYAVDHLFRTERSSLW